MKNVNSPRLVSGKRSRRFLIAFIAFVTVIVLFLVFLNKYSTSPEMVGGVVAFESPPSGHLASLDRKKARDEYFKMLHRDPATGSIPPGIKIRELALAERLPRVEERRRKGNALSLSWSEAGPNDVSGRTRAIAIDVTDSDFILAGGATGGIWKSTNAGANWSLTSPSHLAVTRIAQDPRAGQTAVWYAATGESEGTYNTGTETGETLQGTGIYKSTDRGDSWTRIQVADAPTTSTGLYDFISELVVSPVTGSVFALLNQNGIYRSIDGGSSFNRVLGENNVHPWGDIAVDASGRLLAVLYNTTTFVASGVYRSMDDGASWSEVFANNGSTFPAPYDNYFERTVIGLSASNSDVAYLLTYLGQPKNVTGGQVDDMKLFKLTISTGTYEDRSAGIPAYLNAQGEVNVGGFESQGNYNMAIAVHPLDENHVFIGGTNIFRSRDGFTTVGTASDGWVGGYAIANDISTYADSHPDQHALVFDPNNPERLYSGHDGGVSVNSSVSQTGSIDWIWLNNGYNVTQFYHASMSRVSGDNRIAAGSQDNGSPFFSFDGSVTSSSTDQSSGDGGYQYVGVSDMYSSSQNGRINYFLNDNGTMQFAGEAVPCSNCGALFVHPFAVDPIDESIVFYPAGRDLYRGVAPDQQQTFEHSWTNLNQLQLPVGYGFSALATSTSPTAILYFAGYSATGTPKIFRLPNSWTAVSGATEISIPGATAGAYVLSIAINPSNADEILIAISNYNTESLYHSLDAGQTYSAVEGNLAGSGNDGPSVRSASILPYSNETIYLVATSTGVYSTQSLVGNSTNWAQEGASQMGTVAASWIDSRTSDGRIIVATHGRGVFVGTPSLVGTAHESTDESLPSGFELGGVFPNPFKSRTTLQLSLPAAASVIVQVFDLTGRMVMMVPTRNMAAGEGQQIELDMAALSSGAYYYRVLATMSNRAHVRGGSFVMLK